MKLDETSPEKKKPETGVYKKAIREYAEKMKKDKKPADLLRSNKFFIILLVLLFFVFVAVNSRVNNTNVRLRAQIQATTKQINDLTEATEEERARQEEQERIDAAELTEEQEEVAMNDAKTQGSMVAYLQNQFTVYSDAYQESLEEGDDPTEAMDAYRENINTNQTELEAYFDKNGQTNGLTSWSSILSTTIPGTWEFATNAAFKGETAVVLWFCYANDPDNPEDRSLLGYCTADYDVNTKLFTNVDVQVTRYAQAHAANDSETAPNEDEQPIVEQLQELSKESWVNDTSEDFDQETLDENAALSDTRESYQEAVANGETDAEYDPNYEIGLGETVIENTAEE